LAKTLDFRAAWRQVFANSDANRKNYSRLVSDQAADTQIRAVEVGLNKGSMWGRYLRTACCYHFVGETTMGPALFETGSVFLAIGPAWSWVLDREKHLPTGSTQPRGAKFHSCRLLAQSISLFFFLFCCLRLFVSAARLLFSCRIVFTWKEEIVESVARKNSPFSDLEHAWQSTFCLLSQAGEGFLRDAQSLAVLRHFNVLVNLANFFCVTVTCALPTALGALPIIVSFESYYFFEIWKMLSYLATGDSGYELELQNLVQIQ